MNAKRVASIFFGLFLGSVTTLPALAGRYQVQSGDTVLITGNYSSSDPDDPSENEPLVVNAGACSFQTFGSMSCQLQITQPETLDVSQNILYGDGDETASVNVQIFHGPAQPCAVGNGGFANSCSPVPADDGKNNQKNSCNGASGDPVFPGNGNVHEAVTDFDGPGLLKFKRSYNSRNGWVHNFLTRLIIQGNTIEALRSDESYFLFTGSAQSGWRADPDVNYQLISLPTGDPTGAAYKLVTDHDAVELYDASGLPISVTARGGASVHMSYQNGLLSQVTDDFNRSLTFSYDGHDRLASMTSPAGEQYTYKYDSLGRLTEVGYPDGTSIKYVYEDDTYPFLLTGIIDQDSNRIATWTYDSFGRAVSVSGANGVNAYQFAYQPDDRYVKVTDPLGTVRTLTYQNSQGQLIMTSSDEPCANFGRDVASKTVGYNAQVTRITDYKGNQTLLGYNNRNLVTNITRAWNTGSQMVTQLQYSPNFRLPTFIQVPGKTDQRSYDAAGNLIQQTLTDTTTGNSRTRSATYDAFGRLLTRTDADGNVTHYAYDGKGNLASITDALGHTTSFTHDADGRLLAKTDPNGMVTKYTYDTVGRMVSQTVGAERTAYAYDPAGNLISVTMPSGYMLKLTYDAAHRLVGVKDSLGDQLVYTLNAMGNRVDEKLYDPDGTQVYSHGRIYDALDRLEKDIAASGQATTYGYDANSNLSTVQDPLGHVTQTNYDPLNRRVQTIDALNGVTNYSYNPNGYLSQVVTPNGATTNFSYDGFGQILQESSPDRGVTTYTYDPVGNLVNKTDARGVIAAYAYDPLNRLTGIQYSAAAGSSFTGNPVSDDITLTYDHGDGCTNGIGKLCSAKDASGTSLYSYDPYGNTLTQVHRDAGTQNLSTTQYRYDSLNMVVEITFPDGRKATFKRDGIGRLLALSARINGHRQMITADRQFRADEQIVNQTFGNGLVDQRVYTARGLLSNWDLTGRRAHDRDYSYDDNGNQLGWSSNRTSAVYQYDALDRLIDEQQGNYHNAYSYDANGNRLSQLLPDGSTKAYSYAAQSNRMTQNGSSAVSLDAAGNTLDDGKYQYRYDAAGRLAEVLRGGQAVASYRYDYHGLRRQKITANGTIDFTYDTSGHLIGQLTTGGQNDGQRDYLWTDTAPIALIDSPLGQAKVHKDWLPQAFMGFLHHHEDRENDRAAQLYYLHTDAMGTPKLATNENQQVVWRWNEDAFGANVSTDRSQHSHRDHDWDHGRSHGIQVNLRYPGQYYDAETGLFYNWNRYYDPNTGRYSRSDPIGLSGGVNTFLYVVGNPLGHWDLKGLQISGLPIPMAPPGMGPGFGGNVGAGLPLGLGAIAAVGAIADWAMNNEGEERPPAGSKPIDQTPWSGDHQDIKRSVGAGPKDNVKIDPSDNVWVQNPDGTWTNYGDAGSYTGSGNPSGRRGKDRCKW